MCIYLPPFRLYIPSILIMCVYLITYTHIHTLTYSTEGTYNVSAGRCQYQNCDCLACFALTSNLLHVLTRLRALTISLVILYSRSKE